MLSVDIIAGRGMDTFDVAFARVPHIAKSPEWERFFAAVSWLGSRPVLAVATLTVAAALILRHKTIFAIA